MLVAAGAFDGIYQIIRITTHICASASGCAVEVAFDSARFVQFGTIPAVWTNAYDFILTRSWLREEWIVVGQFDLSFDQVLSEVLWMFVSKGGSESSKFAGMPGVPNRSQFSVIVSLKIWVVGWKVVMANKESVLVPSIELVGDESFGLK